LRTESTEWQRDPKSLIGPNSATGIRVDAKDIALVAAALCPPNQEPRKYIPAAIKLVVESASYLDIENKHLKMASENSLDMVNYNRPEALACLQIRDERTLHKYLAKYLPAVKSEGEWEALRQERKIPRLVLVRVKRDIAKNKLVRARAGYRGQVKKEQADLAKYGG